MNPQKIQIDATLALERLKSELGNPLDVLTVVGIMRRACVEIDKGVEV